MNEGRVDFLIKYALAVAGQGDHGQRELGEIHLIKYVFLGDLGHAQAHGGETFTGAPWRFYKFGPWSEQVYTRIQPVLADVGASVRTFASPKFEGEGVRWEIRDDVDQMVADLEREIPWEVARAVKLAVKKYGDDTSSLLHHVYGTPPMLDAAPNEILGFRAAEPRVSYPVQEEPQLTERQKKKRRQAREKLREDLRARLAAPKLLPPDPAPRYDDVYDEGTRALDADSGPQLRVGSGELTFSSGIWKSRGRHDPELP